MTKQEKIREGLANIIAGFRSDKTLNELPMPLQSIQLRHAEEIIEYLHSQGCVIKVDRELPKTVGGADIMFAQRDMLKVGYVPVEPLIKEGE